MNKQTRYFDLINEMINADKLQINDISKASLENIESAQEANKLGYIVACTTCGDPKCDGEYTHYQ